MVWCRIFGCMLLVMACVCLLCSYAFASESDSADYDGFDIPGNSGAEASEVADDVSDVAQPLALSPVVELSNEADGMAGCYFSADCALGTGVLFYVSPDKIDYLRVDADGYIFNCSDTTVYLAVVGDVETYTISASRFSRFSYRTAGFSATDLELRANDTTVLPSGDSSGAPLSTTSLIVLCAGIFLLFSVIARRSFSYG